MENLNFYAAYSHLYDVYGIEIKDDIFETLGLFAWSKIGNKQVRLYKTQLVPGESEDGGWYVTLPCNVDSIESVTTHYEDYQRTRPTNVRNSGSSMTIENLLEYDKIDTSHLYMSGKLVHYTQLGNRLYFTAPHSVINILYSGVHLDKEGLPFLNIKEVDAIALYCVYTMGFKKARMTHDSATLQMAMADKQLWERACNAARVPLSVSQNEMNDVLDANSSWDRKMYGKTYKPVS